MRRIRNEMARAEAERIFQEEVGDARARLLLIDRAEAAFTNGEFLGAATLVHAEFYLANRAEYEAAPWPKNMVPIAWTRREGRECKHGAF